MTHRLLKPARVSPLLSLAEEMAIWLAAIGAFVILFAAVLGVLS